MPGPSNLSRDRSRQLSQELPCDAGHRPQPITVTRRGALAGVLAAGAGLALSGCTRDEDAGRGRRGRRDRAEQAADGPDADDQDPDIAVAAEALAGERAALDAVEQTLQRHGGLADVLGPVRDAHRAHADLLAEAVPDPRSGTGPAGDPATDPATGSGEPAVNAPVPRSSRAALLRLARAEEALSTSQKQRAFAAQSGAFARLLGSMSASAGQYAVALDPSGPAASGSGS